MQIKNSTVHTTTYHIVFETDTHISIAAQITLGRGKRVERCEIRGSASGDNFMLDLGDLAHYRRVFQFAAVAVCNSAAAFREIERRVDNNERTDLAYTDVMDPMIETIREGISALLNEFGRLERGETRGASCAAEGLIGCIVADISVAISDTYKSI